MFHGVECSQPARLFTVTSSTKFRPGIAQDHLHHISTRSASGSSSEITRVVTSPLTSKSGLRPRFFRLISGSLRWRAYLSTLARQPAAWRQTGFEEPITYKLGTTRGPKPSNFSSGKHCRNLRGLDCKKRQFKRRRCPSSGQSCERLSWPTFAGDPERPPDQEGQPACTDPRGRVTRPATPDGQFYLKDRVGRNQPGHRRPLS